MKTISIDERLKDIASLVDNCHSIADIGTDHGYLPIFLIQTKKADRAYATDIAQMPLKKAFENIRYFQLTDKITTILCNGLQDLPNVDTIIIAGMGGHLMINILKECKIHFHSLILQANNNVPALRNYLTLNNYKIIDEKISYCHKKYYEIIKVLKGKQTLNPLEIEYGPINLTRKSDLFIKKWSNELAKYQNILNDFQGSTSEYHRLETRMAELQAILKK